MSLTYLYGLSLTIIETEFVPRSKQWRFEWKLRAKKTFLVQRDSNPLDLCDTRCCSALTELWSHAQLGKQAIFSGSTNNNTFNTTLICSIPVQRSNRAICVSIAKNWRNPCSAKITIPQRKSFVKNLFKNKNKKADIIFQWVGSVCKNVWKKI